MLHFLNNLSSQAPFGIQFESVGIIVCWTYSRRSHRIRPCSRTCRCRRAPCPGTRRRRRTAYPRDRWAHPSSGWAWPCAALWNVHSVSGKLRFGATGGWRRVSDNKCLNFEMRSIYMSVMGFSSLGGC